MSERLIDTIPVTHLSLKHQTVTDFIEGYIELHEKYFRYRLIFYADYPVDADDESLGMENRLFDEDGYFLRLQISGVEKGYDSVHDIWYVNIMVKGITDQKTYFKIENDAEIFKEKIIKWWLND